MYCYLCLVISILLSGMLILPDVTCWSPTWTSTPHYTTPDKNSHKSCAALHDLDFYASWIVTQEAKITLQEPWWIISEGSAQFLLALLRTTRIFSSKTDRQTKRQADKHQFQSGNKPYWISMTPFDSLWLLMTFLVAFDTLWLIMNLYGHVDFTCLPMAFCDSFLLHMTLYWFLWLPMGPNDTIWFL